MLDVVVRILATALHSAYDDPAFEAPLLNSLTLKRGVGNPTFTRSDTANYSATVTDFEGIIRPVLNGEARFEYARRVENLITASENLGSNVLLYNLSKSSSSVLLGGLPTQRFTLINGGSVGHSVVSGPTPAPALGWSSVSVDVSGLASKIVVLAALNRAIFTWTSPTTISVNTAGLGYAYKILGNYQATLYFYNINISFYLYIGAYGNYNGNGEYIDVTRLSLNSTVGQSDQNPPEYVSSGVLSAPYHGAGVDKVKYFATTNGNTVVNNVVTETVGTPIADATLKGYLAEGARTNKLLNSETVATQNITVTAVPWTLSFWGTGSIALPGVYTGTLTGAGAANRVSLTFTPTTGTLTLTVTGTCTKGQCEIGSFASSVIPTVASAVTRGLSLLKETVNGNLTNTVFTGQIEYTPTAVTTSYIWGSYVDASNYTLLLYSAGSFIFRKRIAGTNYDATIAVTQTVGTKYKIAWRLSPTTGMDIFVNGVKGTGNANTTAMPFSNYFYIGNDGNGVESAWGFLRYYKNYRVAKTDTYCLSVTA
jgi:hypothetical protein